MNDAAPVTENSHAGLMRLGRILIVLAGIFVGQALLYGPSLTGEKILLPLDILEQPYVYIPTMSQSVAPAHNRIQIDLVALGEPARRFAAKEIHAGRFPLWNPNQYAGAPVVFSSFSPFFLLSACFRSPVVIPWIQMLLACVAGLGGYAFFRRGLGVNFWPAAIAAWCYPLTAFFVLWQGYGVEYPVAWLPWMLLAVQMIVEGRAAYGGIGLAALTCLTIVSGNLDVSGQVLLVSGLYALFRYFLVHGRKCFSRAGIATLAVLTIAWALGFVLASPSLMPGLEYAKTGARMSRRIHGSEERPPIGLSTLPEVVMPTIYGTDETGSYPNYPETQGNLPESSSSAYIGLFAALLAAPLAFCSRRHRWLNCFWMFLILFALSWNLNFRPLVALLRLPGLNLMSHNRLVFAASFAMLSMAATGLDVLWRNEARRRWWFAFPIILLAAIYGWNVYRCMWLPEPMATQMAASVTDAHRADWVVTLARVAEIQQWFALHYRIGALMSGIGLACWLLLCCWKGNGRLVVPALGFLLLADLVRFGCGRSTQCDPALYYPRPAVLDEVAKSTPGRVIGYKCLPARLAEMAGLSDARGYDAIDPARYIDLLGIGADPNSPNIPYALTQNLFPKARLAPPDDIRLSPVMDMLGVRYVIFRGMPPPAAHPAFQGLDYWVMVNHSALPRVFVPSRVESVGSDDEALQKLAAPSFNARNVAYVESPAGLPEAIKGAAEIVDEIPTRVDVSARMETAGLLVLADLWDVGWHAYLNGKEVEILRANEALRGVVVPQGESKVEFRYESGSMARGWSFFAGAILVLCGWAGLIALWGKTTKRQEVKSLKG
ncbi:MAG: hypothetical protein WCD79_20280 [Chthoniobacteraceae bacterium]